MKGSVLSLDPNTVHPLPAHDRVAFLRPLITSPKIVVGDYTYYDDPDGPTGFEQHNVLYACGPERLVIAGTPAEIETIGNRRDGNGS
ncbi:hypothetical protein [Streptomyces sp. I8-5]|uniref:hypothetical protein n=1 Tax=Streptomyces sp. I8-5 TaxID=3104277 RepID=UPI00386B14A7